jgi:hypothetical protein
MSRLLHQSAWLRLLLKDWSYGVEYVYRLQHAAHLHLSRLSATELENGIAVCWKD